MYSIPLYHQHMPDALGLGHSNFNVRRGSGQLVIQLQYPSQVRDSELRAWGGSAQSARLVCMCTAYSFSLEQLQLLHLYFTFLFPPVYLRLVHIHFRARQDSCRRVSHMRQLHSVRAKTLKGQCLTCMDSVQRQFVSAKGQ